MREGQSIPGLTRRQFSLLRTPALPPSGITSKLEEFEEGGVKSVNEH